MKLAFTIPGSPVGKQRPRFSRNGSVYTPPETVRYEKLVQNCFVEQCGDATVYPPGVAVCLRVKAFFPVPKSASKGRKADMFAGKVLPCRKPDADNILKIIADALNGFAFADDAQIVDMVVQKAYSAAPCVCVTICAADNAEHREQQKQLTGDYTG